ncbi:YggT family protein [Nocardioides houyundeii]|uniref:YggT family protein n=1 Tax=Nocardioides houyundeii TaxID=2045452 RepID=UPI000C76AB1D|nr:YggT family protein [Nocardioides houyundeii]
MIVVGNILYGLIWLFLALMFVRFIIDWVQVFARQWSPTGPLLVVLEGVYTATDPPIKAVRRFVPPIRLGSLALDLSFMIVFLVAWLLLRVVGIVFFG